MRLSNIISAAILLISPSIISAAPTGHTLYRRDCPSVEAIQNWIQDNANVGENTVFYTAGAKQEQAKAFSDTIDGQYWNKVFGDQYLDWLEECGPGSEQDKLFPRMGEALAKESKTTAYVMMLKGRPIADFWRNYEYPSLKDNGVKIIAVNAEDFNDKKDYVHDQPFKRRLIGGEQLCGRLFTVLGVSNDADADVCLCPEQITSTTVNLWVSGCELNERDARLVSNAYELLTLIPLRLSIPDGFYRLQVWWCEIFPSVYAHPGKTFGIRPALMPGLQSAGSRLNC
ncbi:hypothetical protein J1614_008500 [Plenodomus biglobosus]|nr:hypothetical protein J1614_008500 [Plenodomus biglobosus]